MNQSEARERQELIAALIMTFGKEPSAPQLLGYTMGLDDISTPDLKRAVGRAMHECKFLPVPAELRELSGIATGNQRAALAFDVFANAVSIHGGYASVTFDDPLINATVRNLGGWERCCNVGADEVTKEFETWLRGKFIEVYAGMLKSGANADQCAPLIGIADRENRANGYPTRPLNRIACNLPKHPAGLIRGDVPKQLERPIATMIEHAGQIGVMP